MLHAYADENDLPSRYVAGQVEPSERADFEAHLLECADCQDGVQAADGLMQGLRAATQADTLVMPRVARPSRPLPSRHWMLAMAAAVACWALPLVLLVRMSVQKDRQLAAAERTLAALRASRDPGVPPTDGPLSERLQLENGRLVAELEQARRPQVNVPVLLLSAVRGAGPASGPLPRLVVPAGQAWAVLSLELEAEPGAGEYTAVLLDGQGRALWTGAGLRLRDDALSLALPTALLPPGRYRLRVSSSRPPARLAAFYDFERLP